MVVYSIKDLENLSGVKAHTLRIWEKRYNLITPKRTSTNIRYYTDDDLRQLLNVCILYNKGYKISKIATMDPSTLLEKVSNYSNLELGLEDQLDALMIFILDLDTANFNKVLDQHIIQKGLEETMINILYPLLDKMSIAWLAGSFSGIHESFVTQIIRSKILHSTEDIPLLKSASPKYMLYLPPGEKQELSLLFFQFLLKKNNCAVVNLGSEILLPDVINAAQRCQPEYIFSIVNEVIPQMSFQAYIDELISNIPDQTKILITGHQANVTIEEWPNKVVSLESLADTLAFVKAHKTK